jgi:hypothetical protein
MCVAWTLQELGPTEVLRAARDLHFSPLRALAGSSSSILSASKNVQVSWAGPRPRSARGVEWHQYGGAVEAAQRLAGHRGKPANERNPG